jgi:hypothetical protein
MLTTESYRLKGIKAHRSLDRDMQITEQAMSYDETQKSKSTVVVKGNKKTVVSDSANVPQEAQKSNALELTNPLNGH